MNGDGVRLFQISLLILSRVYGKFLNGSGSCYSYWLCVIEQIREL